MTLNRLRVLLPALLDVLVPTVGYYALHALGMNDVWALTIAGSATAVLTLANTVRRRRLDALGLLVVVEIALAIVLNVTVHDPRLILARPSLYLAVGGLACLVSCFTGRPLTYTGATPMATKGDPERTDAYEQAWTRSAQLRRIHRQLSAFVGLAIIAYAAARIAIIYTMPVASAVIALELPGLAMIAAIILAARLRVPASRRIVDGVQADIRAERTTRETAHA